MTVRPFLAGAVLSVVPVSSFALEGVIVDKRSGRPIAGAEVAILGHAGVTLTDAEGRFTWKPDPTPPFEVLVIVPGGVFMRPVLVDRLPEDGPLRLDVLPLVEETVTVAAGAAPSIVSTPASGTTLISARDLAARQPANLVQALESVAGVHYISDGQTAVPAIRGLARGRTLILIDGARVTSERRVGPSATFLDPFSLESVEVSRGSGSVAYGSDAFGGVIAARTRRVAPGSPLQFRFEGSLGAGVPGGKAGVELARGLDRGGLLFQAHYREFDDYRSPAGDVFNSGYRDQGFLGRIEHAVGPGTLSIGWQTDLGRDIERPRNNSRTVRFFYPTEDSHRFTAAYTTGPLAGFSRLGLHAFLGSYSIVTDQDRYATATTPRSVERADVSARDFHVRGFAARIAGGTKMEFGVDVNGRFGLEALDIVMSYDQSGRLAASTTNVSVDDARRVDTGVYATAETALGRAVTVAGGARGDRVTTVNSGGYFGDRSTAHAAAAGFASLAVGPFSGLGLTAQISRGFRDPMLSDRYYRGPTGRGFITGNPDLEPETSLQYDLAARYTMPRGRLAAYAYHYRISDLVERYETTRDNFFFRNRGRARIRGFEVEAQADLGRGLLLSLAGQVSRGRALDDGSNLDDVAADSVSVTVRQALKRGFVQVRAAGYADDDRPGPTEQRTPGYVLIDASGAWALTGQLELRVVARNLLDATYLLSPDPRAVLAPGVNALVTAAVRF
jgi:outer membrane receptor protein involved in Fe transport